MNISVMIATRNRRTDLERTLRILARMNPQPSEVLVCADGCEDGTVELVRADFPWVALLTNARALGSVPSRDRMLRLTRADVVVSLDDDSYPLEQDFFSLLPHVMRAHPEAAVVTFPELRDEGLFAYGTMVPDSPGRFVSWYANCAAAMWRHVYLESGGFPLFFVHAYEEVDYALQCYARGYGVWFEPSLIVRHHVSLVNRDNLRTHQLNARNELWGVWMRCPWHAVIVVSAYRILRQLLSAIAHGVSWVVREPEWWFRAIRGLITCLRQREAVEWRIYYHWLLLARRPISDRRTLTKRFGARRDVRHPSTA
jgi:GT2 family glycosyltransferase